jgi:choline kinase
MRAVLLAAGRGKRLGIDGPKCLLAIAGKSLLERHLINMAAAGIDEVTVVTGHAHELIDAELARIAQAADAPSLSVETPSVETQFNERFVHGSIVSLQCAMGWLCDAGGLWMDADVLYPPALLRRLVASEHGSCVLLDGSSSEQGEEMMLAVSDERVQRIARTVGSDWDLVGESVGFFKANADAAAVMKRVLDAEIAAGRLDQEHEDALNIALPEATFGHERVDGLPWTEIDFPEDIEKATEIAQSIDA